MSQQNVLQCRRDEDRKDRNMKDNTEEEWEEVVQIFRKKKKKEKEERKFRKKEAVQVKGRTTEIKIKSFKENTDNSTYHNYK